MGFLKVRYSGAETAIPNRLMRTITKKYKNYCLISRRRGTLSTFW